MSPTHLAATRRRYHAPIAWAVAILLIPVQSAGQTPESGLGWADGGLWWGVAAGGGSTRLTCDLCRAGRDLGPSLSASVGAWAAPGLRVGLEGGGWSHDDDGTRESVYRAGLLAQLHPSDRGLFFHGGVGWSGYRAGDFHYDAGHLTVGAGWDLPLTDRWVVGNTVSVDAASFGSLRNEGRRVAGDVGLSVIRFAVHVRNERGGGA